MITKLFDLFAPNRCRNCDYILPGAQEILCVPCSAKLPYTYWEMGVENEMFVKLDLLAQHSIQQSTALLFFKKGNITQKLLHALKYYNQPQIGTYLAYLAKSKIELSTIDYLIAVPVHSKKKKDRGYNQTHTFVKTLSQLYEIPYDVEMLFRVKHKASQTTKNRTKRLNSLQNTFDIKDTANKKFAHKHILLIDDLCTTGATLLSCTQALDNIPGVRISVLTIGYAV